MIRQGLVYLLLLAQFMPYDNRWTAKKLKFIGIILGRTISIDGINQLST
jgi:hypothetical protein